MNKNKNKKKTIYEFRLSVIQDLSQGTTKSYLYNIPNWHYLTHYYPWYWSLFRNWSCEADVNFILLNNINEENNLTKNFSCNFEYGSTYCTSELIKWDVMLYVNFLLSEKYWLNFTGSFQCWKWFCQKQIN